MPSQAFEFILGITDKCNRFQIHSLSALYRMCLSKEKSDSYNGVPIDEILVDVENAEKYKNGIEGYRIVETSTDYKIKGEYAFIMSYPADKSGNSKVKIIFDNKKAFWRQYYKLTDSERTLPIIIAGDWKLTPNETEFQSQCIIHRTGQIHYVKA